MLSADSQMVRSKLPENPRPKSSQVRPYGAVIMPRTDSQAVGRETPDQLTKAPSGCMSWPTVANTDSQAVRRKAPEQLTKVVLEVWLYRGRYRVKR